MTIYVNARAIIERESDGGTEILLQIRSRDGEPERWELPGGQIAQFEPVLGALEREIREETGLKLALVDNLDGRQIHENDDAVVETLEPLFAYQTLRGPVDSLGFYFRCRVEGEINQHGDDAKQPTWFPVETLQDMHRENPAQFDWLTRAALTRYLDRHRNTTS